MEVASVAAPAGPAVVALARADAGGPQSVAFAPQAVAAQAPAVATETRQVTTIQANVRAVPSMSGPVARTFTRGQVVQVLPTENGWTRVAERDGVSIGWMHN